MCGVHGQVCCFLFWVSESLGLVAWGFELCSNVADYQMKYASRVSGLVLFVRVFVNDGLL